MSQTTMPESDPWHLPLEWLTPQLPASEHSCSTQICSVSQGRHVFILHLWMWLFICFFSKRSDTNWKTLQTWHSLPVQWRKRLTLRLEREWYQLITKQRNILSSESISMPGLWNERKGCLRSYAWWYSDMSQCCGCMQVHAFVLEVQNEDGKPRDGLKP